LLLEKACSSSGLPGAALAQLAAIVSPANKPAKVKWSLSWCGKLFFNKGSAPLGKAWHLNLAIAFGKKFASQQLQAFFFSKKWSPKLSCHNSETLKTIHGFRIIWENLPQYRT